MPPRSLAAAAAAADAADPAGATLPNIMDQTLGPSPPPMERQTTIKCLLNGGEAGGHQGGQSRDFEAECATLVHCRLLKSEEGLESFRNLTLRPVYWKEFKVRKRRNNGGRLGNGSLFGVVEAPPDHPLQSKNHAHLMSHTALFTSHNEGHLYHLPGHIRQPGRGCGVRKAATYPFTSPVGQVALEPALMHALTETGLETYTLKAAGAHTVKEAEKLDGRTNACPTNFASEDESPICLVGLRPFLGARFVAASKRHVVLISQNSETSEWTCYSLRMPTVSALHGDMMQLADMNRAVSPQGYFQLLCEAHVVARTAMHHYAWAAAKSADQASSAAEERDAALDRFRESCRRLADYYVTSSEATEYKKALPYFRMGGQTMAELLREVRGQARISLGLLHILKQVVQSPTKEESAQLNDATVADEIIDVLGTKSIDSLAALVVNSPAFRGFKTSKMFHHFDRHLKRQDSESGANPDPQEALAFALLSVDVGGGAESVRDVLRRTQFAQFAGLLIEKHDFLLDDAGGAAAETAFSDLAVLVRDCLPRLFVEVLVSLIRGGVFSLTAILQG